ncbi:DUF3570 domain-containing protein [Chitinivorax sp. B]|uniref:DUF3570 domain-containing protein n=1 Tax=Chitinivorax sp. B TaxID=2502235 RepID=UPI001485700D|nr:DUF3570 domain-containing protein [Chitinivorax sp. B]
MRKPLLILSAAAVLADPVVAADTFDIQHSRYRESDERVAVDFTNLKLSHEIGTDHTVTVNASYDAISGATPAWQAASPMYAVPDDVKHDADGQQLYGQAVDGRYLVRKVALTDTRKAASGTWAWRNARRDEWTVGAAHSREKDFLSNEVSLETRINHTAERNWVWLAGVARQWNETDTLAADFSTHRQSFAISSLTLGALVTLSRDSMLELRGYGARDRGFLSNHYQTVLRKQDDTLYLAADSRPRNRDSGGVKVRWMQAWTPTLGSQLSYRYYRDSWEMRSHTVEAQLTWQATPSVRISPSWRGYHQQAAFFYKPWKADEPAFGLRGYASNDDRLGKFDSHTVSLNGDWRFHPDWQLIAGATRYRQSTGLTANWLSVGVQYRF